MNRNDLVLSVAVIALAALGFMALFKFVAGPQRVATDCRERCAEGGLVFTGTRGLECVCEVP